MALHFTPKTEKELMAERILAEGEYHFEVLEAEEQAGDYGPYIKLKLILTGHDGRRFTKYDNLSTSEWGMMKLRNACHEMGLLNKYEQGSIEADDFLLGNGTLIVAHRTSKKTNMLEAYIKDYGKKQLNPKDAPKEYDVYAALSDKKAAPNGIVDDDIPF